jgi:hypothetical protein
VSNNDAPDRLEFSASASRERNPKPRWESALESLAVALMIPGLLLGIIPWLLPADWSLDARHNLSDIGFLLSLAGVLLYAASTLLTDRRQGFTTTRRFLQYWSARLVLLGGIAFAPFAVWLSVADLVGPPLRLMFPTSLPPVADLATGGALCLSLLGMLLVVPELLWRSWRERRAQQTAGAERK